MSRRLRFQENPSTLHFVTDRCFHGRYLLRPSVEANELIIGCLAHTKKRFEVKVYGHCFLSNHYHLLLGAPNAAELAGFMQYFKSNLSREIGRIHEWKGALWENRYTASPVLDEGAVIERMKYIFSNSVKEGLVRHTRDYPGVHCHDDLVDGRILRGIWVDHTASRRTRRRVVIDYTLRCDRLPFLEDLTDSQHKMLMGDLSKEVHGQLDPKRKVLGPAKILAAHPHDRTSRLPRRARPLCHSTCPDLKRAFKAAYRAFVEGYRDVYSRLKETRVIGSLFPAGGLPPVTWWGTPLVPT